MATIKIGNTTFNIGKVLEISGKTLTSDGDVVGGVVIEEGLKIELHGEIESLTCDKSVSITGTIRGNVHSRGSVNCDDVRGNIYCDGAVNCDNVGGDVKANVVNCEDVGGSVSASVVNRS